MAAEVADINLNDTESAEQNTSGAEVNLDFIGAS
jgi:hypothetical protein